MEKVPDSQKIQFLARSHTIQCHLSFVCMLTHFCSLPLSVLLPLQTFKYFQAWLEYIFLYSLTPIYYEESFLLSNQSNYIERYLGQCKLHLPALHLLTLNYSANSCKGLFLISTDQFLIGHPQGSKSCVAGAVIKTASSIYQMTD